MTDSPKHHIILASRSPYRRALLDKIGLRADPVPADINEAPRPGERPADLALRLAREKAEHIAAKHFSSLVIGSDQVAELNGNPLGKPGSRLRAIEQLQACSGKAVVFHTGLCVINSATGHTQQCCEKTTVHFRELSSEQIARYIDAEPALDCAGSFKAEGLGITLFRSIEGTDPNALIGLPLIRLVEFLGKEGLPLP